MLDFFKFGPNTRVEPADQELADALNRLARELIPTKWPLEPPIPDGPAHEIVEAEWDNNSP